MPKYQQIVTMLEDRVAHGDYLAKPIPSETELAQELQINRRTLRKAVQELLDDGRLIRQPNGRLALPAATQKSGMNIALLASTYPTPWVAAWEQVIERQVQARGWRLRLVGFTHWNDPTIWSVLRGFDGTFFLMPGGDAPQDVLTRIRDLGSRVVFLEEDLSGMGLPSLRSFTPSSIAKLLEHLVRLGHRRIACLNTQPLTGVIKERIDQWQLWTAAHHCSGPLINEPVVVGESAMDAAYKTTRRVLRQHKLEATAIFCATAAAGLAAMRAIADEGLAVGKDLSICVGDDDAGRAQFLTPSLTSLKDPPWKPYLNVCLDWFANAAKPWVGPLLVQPPDVPIFIGESTGPAPDRKPRKST